MTSGFAGLLFIAASAFATVAQADGAALPKASATALIAFDGKPSVAALGEVWEAWPPRAGNRVEAALECPAPTPDGQAALSLGYRFAHDEPAQLGFRIRLNRVDARGYDHLAFWVKGEPSGQPVAPFKLEFHRPEPTIPGLSQRGSTVIEGVSDTWRRQLVPLTRFTGIADWTDLDALVINIQSRRTTRPAGHYCFGAFELIRTGERGPSAHDRLEPVKKKAWETTVGGPAAAKPLLRARLRAWPERSTLDPEELRADDQTFLRRVARDTWRGLDGLRDRENGLPLDTLRFGRDSTELAHARIGDYTNVTNVGLYLMAVAAARELDFIDASAARERVAQLLDTLGRLETHRGFFYNYYDTTSLERSSHFVSFVDSAWLSAGLIIARQAFPELRPRIDPILNREDYGFFYDPVEQLMSHGYYVNVPSPAEYHYGLLFTEARLGSVIAIGKGDVPETHWFKMIRSFPAEYRWQSQPPRGAALRRIAGHEVMSGYYRWGDERFVPSWGGSLFEALMPTLVLDENRHAPNSLGANSAAHVRVQRQYAREVLKSPVWGFSPSSTPSGDNYAEYGVKALGAKGYPSTAVTPHASALALAVAPEAAIENLRELARRYPIYGEFGYYDAVDPVTGEVAHKYLALDQGMLFLAIANHLRDGVIRRYFESDPIIRRALPMLGRERFWEDD